MENGDSDTHMLHSLVSKETHNLLDWSEDHINDVTSVQADDQKFVCNASSQVCMI